MAQPKYKVGDRVRLVSDVKVIEENGLPKEFAGRVFDIVEIEPLNSSSDGVQRYGINVGERHWVVREYQIEGLAFSDYPNKAEKSFKLIENREYILTSLSTGYLKGFEVGEVVRLINKRICEVKNKSGVSGYASSEILKELPASDKPKEMEKTVAQLDDHETHVSVNEATMARLKEALELDLRKSPIPELGCKWDKIGKMLGRKEGEYIFQTIATKVLYGKN